MNRQSYHRGLDLSALVSAAVEVGLPSLSISAVATRLKVSSAAIYRHVSSREELEIAVANHLLHGLDVPQSAQSARAFLLAFGKGLFALSAETPGLSELLYRHREHCTEISRLDRWGAEQLTRFGIAADVGEILVGTVALISLSVSHADRETRKQAGNTHDTAVDIGGGRVLTGSQRLAFLLLPVVDGLLSYAQEAPDSNALLARIEEELQGV